MAFAYDGMLPSSVPRYLGWRGAHYLRFDASLYNPIYNDDCKTVQPPAVTLNFYIKAK